MLSLQRESWGWCPREGLHGPGQADVSRRARPGFGLMAVAPQAVANPHWRCVMLNWGVSPLSSVTCPLLMKTGCHIIFLLLNYVLLGLLGSVTSRSVRPRRSGASPRVSGGAMVLIWRCCQYQGMQSAAPSRGAGGSCCQVGVLVTPAECSSCCTALLLASDICPSLGAEDLPKEFAGLGPERFAGWKMG